MHITLLTYSSRGDFQSYLALSAALQKAGHIVRLETKTGRCDSALQIEKIGDGSDRPSRTYPKIMEETLFESARLRRALSKSEPI